jgi:hypothetical protein
MTIDDWLLTIVSSKLGWAAASKPKALGMVAKSHPQAALEVATRL